MAGSAKRSRSSSRRRRKLAGAQPPPVRIEPEVRSTAVPEAEPRDERAIEPEAEAKPQTQHAAEPRTEAKPQTQRAAEPQAKAKPQTRRAAEPQAKAKPQTQRAAEPRKEAKPQTQRAAEPRAKPKAEHDEVRKAGPPRGRSDTRPRSRVRSTGDLAFELTQGADDEVVVEPTSTEPLRGRYLMKELFD